MKSILAHILTVVSLIFLWPHFLFYLMSSNKNYIKSDTLSIMSKRHIRMNTTLAIFYIIIVDTYYRSLFYYRIGRKSLLIKWYFPGSKFISISNDMSLGRHVYLAHPMSTFINAKKIGDNFTIRQNTTIGNKMKGKRDSRPTIGNGVELGANVCIIGDITIGDNVIVGAGSVVVKSIPANTIVAGNPAKIIKINK